MKRFPLIPALGILLTVFSCRKAVLEDRTGCPAFIFFHHEGDVQLSGKDYLKIELRDASTLELLAGDSPLVEEIVPGEYFLTAGKREEMVATCISGIRMSSRSGNRLILPYGNQGDPIYHCVYKARLTGEELDVPINLSKDHSVITVRFEAYKDSFPFDIIVNANTAGMETMSGRPLKGKFRYAPLETDPGTYIFTVPRQADYSLSMDVVAKPGMNPEHGHIESIVLWKALQNIRGFNWELENLPDIDVTLDINRSTATVGINGWEVESITQITI